MNKVFNILSTTLILNAKSLLTGKNNKRY